MRFHVFERVIRSIGLAALAGVLLSLCSGCGGIDYKARGVVKGKVTLKKKPLPAGAVVFYGKEGNMTATAVLDENGNYEMPDAPLGECAVAVTTPEIPRDPSVLARMQGKGKGPKMPEGPKNPDATEGPGLPSGAKMPKEIVPVDAKYSKPETSGLKFTVEKGEQTYNIDL